MDGDALPALDNIGPGPDARDGEQAGEELGLSGEDMRAIVAAADNSTNTGAPLTEFPMLAAVRARMLEAVGLRDGAI